MGRRSCGTHGAMVLTKNDSKDIEDRPSPYTQASVHPVRSLVEMKLDWGSKELIETDDGPIPQLIECLKPQALKTQNLKP